jgi:hypothetical protein
VPSDRTLAKQLEARRTWTVTTLAPDGKWYQRDVNAVRAQAKQLVTRVRLPGKREREAMRALQLSGGKP